MTKEYTKVCIQYDFIILYNVCTVKYKHWQKKKNDVMGQESSHHYQGND